jgi:hypothetical protein
MVGSRWWIRPVPRLCELWTAPELRHPPDDIGVDLGARRIAPDDEMLTLQATREAVAVDLFDGGGLGAFALWRSRCRHGRRWCRPG